MTAPRQSQPVWWLQLVDSTAIENHEAIRRIVATWDIGATWAEGEHRLHLDWDDASPLPESISVHGFAGYIPDVEGYLNAIQPHLQDREHMIFSIVTNHSIVDRSHIIRVLVVTPRIVAEISGMELVERAKRVVLASEEELLNPEETS